jgi:hypothetical protein
MRTLYVVSLYKGLVVSAAEEHLRRHCPTDVNIEYFEFYNAKTERFEILLPSDSLDVELRLFSVVANTRGNEEEEPLRIEGRAFDISGGLYIDSRSLRIEEQVNRSEGK